MFDESVHIFVKESREAQCCVPTSHTVVNPTVVKSRSPVMIPAKNIFFLMGRFFLLLTDL